MDRVLLINAAGSSPLTQGKPVDGAGHVRLGRLIPAHAGKTSAISRVARADKAHPRSRGENSLILTGRLGGAGSSPLTRGKLPSASRRISPTGLIPAHAGKTGSLSVIRTPAPAHPRSRGENAPSNVPSSWYSGSSPLTRGKLNRGRGDRDALRLIPAHAGKTTSHSSKRASAKAHPRSRGENPLENAVDA